MKKKLINSSIEILKKTNKYSEEDIEIIIYGLEGIYLTITKMIIIFLIAYILNIWKETILILISYNIIRTNSFGIHASKSIYCLISSILLFIGGAIICKYITLPFKFCLISAIICNFLLLLYSPADTHKRPIINAKKRKRFKYLSFLSGIIYTILIILLRNYSIINYLTLGMIEAILMILPITYSICKMPYNNYKTYYTDV